MTPDQRITRRVLFETFARRAGQTAIGVSILSACAPAIGSAEPSKTAETIEQKVRSAGVSEWRKMLSQNGSYKGAADFDFSFSTSIANPNAWNDRLFEQLASGQKIKEPLRMKWTAVKSKTDPKLGQAGERWFGEAEFSNVVLIVAGKNSGSSGWDGLVKLTFDERGHSVLESPGSGWVTDKNRFQAWMSSAPKEFEQTLESLKPIPSGFEFGLTLTGGKVKVSLPWELNYFNQMSAGMPEMIGRYYRPSTFMTCFSGPQANCRVVNLGLTGH